MPLNRRTFLGQLGAGMATAAAAATRTVRAVAPHRAARHAALHRPRRDGEGLRRHARQGRGARLQGSRVRRLLRQDAAGGEGGARQARPDVAVDARRLRPARRQVPGGHRGQPRSSATSSSSTRGSRRRSATSLAPGSAPPRRSTAPASRARRRASSSRITTITSSSCRSTGKMPLELLLEDLRSGAGRRSSWICAGRRRPDRIRWPGSSKHPGRFPMVHVKGLKRLPPDAAKWTTAPPIEQLLPDVADVGPGPIDWARIFAHADRRPASSTTSSSTISRRHRSTAWRRARSTRRRCGSEGVMRDASTVVLAWQLDTRPAPDVAAAVAAAADRHHRRRRHRPHRAPAGLSPARLPGGRHLRHRSRRRDADRARRSTSRRSTGRSTQAAAVEDAVFDLAVPGDQIVGILEQLPAGAPVLMQKPMGRDLAEARRILAVLPRAAA